MYREPVPEVSPVPTRAIVSALLNQDKVRIMFPPLPSSALRLTETSPMSWGQRKASPSPNVPGNKGAAADSHDGDARDDLNEAPPAEDAPGIDSSTFTASPIPP